MVAVKQTSAAEVDKPLRIAIASSGLGHIARGVETWAECLGESLHGRGYDVRLFQGANSVDARWRETLPCIKRFDPRTLKIVKFFEGKGGWRFGFANGYCAEQTTFSLSLWKRIAASFDILHVQDPQIATWLDRLHHLGLSRPRVILGHGTEERVSMLQTYSYLQHLAPVYQAQYAEFKPARQLDFAIPNYVDTKIFRPGDQALSRKEWGLPLDCPIVLCVAAIRTTHKRVDYLIREFATYLERSGSNARLVIAGGYHAKETEEIKQLASTLLGGRVVFFDNLARERVSSLLRTADLFVLASLVEMLPIALLEAMATGLPVICNNTPVLCWVVGPGGMQLDLSHPGALAGSLASLENQARLKQLGVLARERIQTMFSEPVVVDQILNMYRQVMRR